MDSSNKELKKTETNTKEKKKRSVGKRNKEKGNAYELAIVNELKAMGYEAGSSRNESKKMDAEKVDIISDFPYFIQCKCVTGRPNYPEIFKSFKLSNIKPLAVFHKTQVKKTVNFASEGEFVIIKKEDFYKLIKDGFK